MTEQVIVTRPQVTQVEVAHPGVQGQPFPGVPTFIQQTDPGLGTPYVWFRTDTSGVCVDILVGP